MKPAIEIRNLGKEYKLASSQRYIALRDVITNGLKNIISSGKKSTEKFWALKDINIDIMPGERVGIIGRNGAGKSTLLKIISRITPPTTGEAIIRGRVGSLLEVGTGFHPELTGRENIYLNGSILGLKRAEINRNLEEIIDFSGVEKFIDTPLKRYSSGMQMRLAFSVAAHLQSEILLIDEVLAVGDIEFQKKCIGKMEEVSKSEGRTILFVSHDLSAISTLTEKCLLLKQGKPESFNDTQNVISEYSKIITDYSDFKTAAKPDLPTITRVKLISSEGSNLQGFNKPLSIIFEINMPVENYSGLALSFQVFNQLNQPVLYNWIFDIERNICRRKGINILNFTYPELKLYKANYFLKVHLAETKGRKKFQEFECCNFSVEMINIKEPEWGWQPNVTQFLDPGKWDIN